MTLALVVFREDSSSLPTRLSQRHLLVCIANTLCLAMHMARISLVLLTNLWSQDIWSQDKRESRGTLVSLGPEVGVLGTRERSLSFVLW